MKLSARSAAWLLPLLLTGCPHKTQVAQNPPLAPAIEDTPPPKPQPAPTNLPPPEITVPVQPAPPVTTVAPPPAPPKKAPKHKKPATPSTNSPTQQASTAAIEVPAIGQLTSGDPPDLRQQTDSSIASTERGLNGLNRTMSDQDSKTATQIREFLKQARAALTSGDVDGAHTLAIKAKVLLDELSSK